MGTLAEQGSIEKTERAAALEAEILCFERWQQSETLARGRVVYRAGLNPLHNRFPRNPSPRFPQEENQISRSAA
jgi:hypothetical protein